MLLVTVSLHQNTESSLMLRFILIVMWVVNVFFFSSRRRHTRLQGDWSSDVCSSDLGLVLRSAALKEFEMSGVGEVVDLFRLPRVQPLTVVADGSAVAGCCHLFGECHGIAGEVEGFGGEHTCGLVVVVIFACNVEWEPRHDYFWSCETH